MFPPGARLSCLSFQAPIESTALAATKGVRLLDRLVLTTQMQTHAILPCMAYRCSSACPARSGIAISMRKSPIVAVCLVNIVCGTFASPEGSLPASSDVRLGIDTVLCPNPKPEESFVWSNLLISSLFCLPGSESSFQKFWCTLCTDNEPFCCPVLLDFFKLKTKSNPEKKLNQIHSW